MLKYQDKITLVSVEIDEYGTEYAKDEAVIPAIVDYSSGYTHSDHQDLLDTDAVVAIDPNNQFVLDNHFRLEEFLVKIKLLNKTDWYKITDVSIAKDSLLCNKFRHIELRLKKTAGVEDVS